MPLGILIILYALAGTIEIPVSCFVVTWVWLIFYILFAIYGIISKDN